MSHGDAEYDRIERLMKQATVSDLSEALKKRVVGAARKAWLEDRDDVPARIVLVRLAISAAAAILVVSSAEFYSRHVASHEHPGVIRPATESADLGVTLQLHDLKIVRHLVTNVRGGSQIDAQAVRTHVERTRKTLDESPKNGISGSTEGRSGPIPHERDLASYS